MVENLGWVSCMCMRSLGPFCPFISSSATAIRPCPLLVSNRNRNRVLSFMHIHKSSRRAKGFHSHATPERRDSPTPSDNKLRQEDGWSSTGWLVTVHRIQAATQIFLVALFWIFLFFGTSVWDGTKNQRDNKSGSKRK